jgi:COMPASS component SWD1
MLQAAEKMIDEDAYIDVETCEKNSSFSGFEEDSADEIIYLPAIPSPDVPDEQPDKCLVSSSKLEDSNHSGSPSSMDAVQNGLVIPPASSPLEGKAVDFCNYTHFSSVLFCGSYYLFSVEIY